MKEHPIPLSAPLARPKATADELRSIGCEVAAFLYRINGRDDIPESVRKEALRLAKEYRRVALA